MATTSRLALPLIEASQAQKHVTHNEALRILDAAIQVSVIDLTRTEPPPTPGEGDRHIVAASSTGAWAGAEYSIATWEEGAWRFLAPQVGWCVWSIADEVMFVWDGAAWRDQRDLPVSLGSISSLGINGGADATNRLALHSNAALFRAITAAESGTGDMRLQITKEGTDDTASVVFSNNFSGRAEFGLTGSDSFALKVSSDGSTWLDALAIDPSTALTSLKGPISLGATISPASLSTQQNDYAPTGLSSASVVNLSAAASVSVTGLADGVDGRVVALVNAGALAITLVAQSLASLAPNRFAASEDVVLGADSAAILRYDGGASRWRYLARPSATSGSSTIADVQRMLMSMAIARNAALAQFYGMAFADSFAATTYVDVAGATNLSIGTGLLKPTSSSTYAQISQASGTTIGNMTVNGGLAAAFDGNDTQAYASCAAYAVAGGQGFIGKDWGSGVTRLVEKVDVISTTDYGFTGGTSNVQVTVQGSQDNTNWTTLFSQTFANVATGQTRTITEADGLLIGTAYRYHRVSIQDLTGSLYAKVAELKFYTATHSTSNFSVTSSSITVASVPSSVMPIARIKHVDAATPGTDYNLFVSRDGGATYSAAASLTSWFTDPSDGARIVYGAPLNVSGQPSGSNVRIKLTSANNKNIELRDWGFIAS